MKTSTVFFGKYKGQTWEQVKQDDPGYLMWMRNNMGWMDDPQPVIDIIDSLFTVKQDLMADQAVAADEISTMLLSGNNRVHRLQGGAGYGKSYVVTEIARRALVQGYRILGIANSYVATQVLSQSLKPVGVECKTIASALRLSPDKTQKKERYIKTSWTSMDLTEKILKGKSLLIIDEYSMCSDDVVNVIYSAMGTIDNTSKLLVVGDNKQLPSPEQEHMCRFDLIDPYSELTIPKRFKPNSTLHQLEMAVRNDPWNLGKHLSAFGKANVSSIALAEQMILDMNEHPDDTSVMLFYRRDAVARANKEIRTMVYGENAGEIETGERLRVIRTTFMKQIDELTGHASDARYYSGTFLIVDKIYTDRVVVSFRIADLPDNNCPSVSVECHHVNDTRIPLIFSKTEYKADPEMYGGEQFNKALDTVRDYCQKEEKNIKGVWRIYHYFRDKFLQVSYGYATTVHRSQGASVDRIYLRPQDVLQGDRFIAPRLAYVAATRAKKAVNYTL